MPITTTLAVTSARGYGRTLTAGEPLNEWEIVNPGQILYDVTYSGDLNRYVAVGNYGTIMYSLDGNTWTCLQPQVHNTLGVVPTLRSVAYGLGRFVAVGSSGSIFTSPDGIAWTQKQSWVTDTLSSVFFDSVSSKFLVVGFNGVYLTSDTAGETWSSSPNQFGTAELYDITRNPSGTCIVVGGAGYIAASSDTNNWNQVTTTGTTQWLYSVVWNNEENRFLAVGGGGVIVRSNSGNGLAAWTTLTSPTSNNIRKIRRSIWGGHVMCGDTGILFTSPDGVTWTNRFPPSSVSMWGLAFNESTIFCVGSNSVIIKTTNGGVDWLIHQSFAGITLNGVAYSSAWNKFVAVGNSGAVFASEDGKNWTLVPTYTSIASYTDVCVGANGFFAVGNNGKIIGSSDGISWTDYTGASTASLRSVAYGASKYAVTGAFSTIFTSPNGATWTSNDNGGSLILSSGESIAWSGSEFVAATQEGLLYYSSNGTSWSPNQFSRPAYLREAYSGGNSVTVLSGGLIMRNNSLPYVYRSTVSLASVCRGADKYVVVGAGGTILTSPDGIIWTSQSSGTTQQLNDVIWNGSQYVAVGGGGTIRTSPDGVTWTARTSGTSQQLFGVAWSGSMFVAVGQQGTSRSSDGITWTGVTGMGFIANSISYGAGLFVAVGSSGAIFTSPNGETWTSRTSNTTANFRHIIWQTTNATPSFVAVGDGPIRTSVDGISWITVSYDSNALASIYGFRMVQSIPGNGQVIARGTFNEQVLINNDNTSVYMTGAAASPPIFDITFFPAIGRFVAVGGAGRVMRLNSGNNFPLLRSGPINNGTGLNAVTVADSNLIAVGSNGTVYTSADALSWSQKAIKKVIVGVEITVPLTNQGLNEVAWNPNAKKAVAVGVNGAILVSK